MGSFRNGKHRFFVHVMGALLLASILEACSDGSTSSSGGAVTAGRGSPACHSWQDAICAFLAKCGGVTRADCDAQAKGITCSSDQLASDCATSLRAASCSAAPSGCDFYGVADPAPAIAACNQFVDAACGADARCGGPTVEECRASIATTVDCTAVVGYKLSFESCMRALENYVCGSPYPSICNEVLLQ